MTLDPTTAPLFVVDGPRPRPPKYRLLDTADIVDETDPHWQAGVSVWSYQSDEPVSWAPCSTGTFRSKVSVSTVPLPQFGAFVVYLTEECTPRSIFTGQDTPESAQAKYLERALAVFNATESFAVESEFVKGAALPGNPHLADPNCIVLAAGAAQAPKVGLARLANEVGKTGRDGIIHMTPAILVALGQFRSYRGDDNRLYTVEGTPIAEGTGYIGAAPEPHGAPADGEDWAWATGPVEIRRSQPIVYPGNVAQALDRAQNLITYRVERTYVVTWDTALQAAVLIDWTSTTT